MRVFITGGTGLVGSRLVEKLLAHGDTAAVLTRRPDAARQKWGDRVTTVSGDPTQPGPWMDAVADCDAVVNLAGEGVFNRRWTESFKQTLRDSRVHGTTNVVAALARYPGTPRTLVNASAIGYYGPHGDEELTEESLPGSDFLARLCVEWEQAAEAATAHGVRVVTLRVGVVLDPAGGALTKMLTPFKLFVGGPIGSGRQYVSWIHHEDMIGLILFALDHPEVHGSLNGTAPQPITNRDFSTALGKALHRPSFLPGPTFALRMVLGEVADVITKGQRVIPKRAQELGYDFRFAEVNKAIQDVLGSRKKIGVYT